MSFKKHGNYAFLFLFLLFAHNKSTCGSDQSERHCRSADHGSTSAFLFYGSRGSIRSVGFGGVGRSGTIIGIVFATVVIAVITAVVVTVVSAVIATLTFVSSKQSLIIVCKCKVLNVV